MVVGNLLEPRVLGRTLGLSPLIVLLGMLFWSWLWGPAGALLSVPLMMVAKIALENDEDLAWIARLVEPAPSSVKLNPLRGRAVRKPRLTPPTVALGLDDVLPSSTK
jgi:AI-2 transport protein TqsA